MYKSALLPALSIVLLLGQGCAKRTRNEPAVEKKPRPVEVQTLSIQPAPQSLLVSASAASWKTEAIGFEVSGRIEWVVEPNTDIEARVIGANGQEILEGTPIAQIEIEQYSLQVDSAQKEVERAIQDVRAAEIELNESIPAQLRAAEAERKLSQIQYDRKKRLFEQNATAESEVDLEEANLENAISRIKQLEANRMAKASEKQSLQLQVEKAKLAQNDAKRNLEDCTLYSSFRGQIAEVHVVPGSVVNPGTPVATIQMMDPIKIELEVSADDSRRLRKRQRLLLLVTQADGSVEEHDGFLYLIDPVADPQTRTFTLTLLMLNKKTGRSAADLERDIPITDQAWRLDFSFLPGAEQGLTFVADQAIRKDAAGYFLWRINNFQKNSPLPEDRLFKVSKLRIELGESRLPFLGNWIFQQVIVLDDAFDPNVHLVAGKLTVKDGNPDDWTGDTVLVDRDTQWMVRPGDQVRVNISDVSAHSGYYVPMDAIAREADKTYLFLVDHSSSPPVVQRVEVALTREEGRSTTSSLRRIEPLGDLESLEGRQFVTRGVHYLREGEAVKITSREGIAQ